MTEATFQTRLVTAHRIFKGLEKAFNRVKSECETEEDYVEAYGEHEWGLLYGVYHQPEVFEAISEIDAEDFGADFNELYEYNSDFLLEVLEARSTEGGYSQYPVTIMQEIAVFAVIGLYGNRIKF